MAKETMPHQPLPDLTMGERQMSETSIQTYVKKRPSLTQRAKTLKTANPNSSKRKSAGSSKSYKRDDKCKGVDSGVKKGHNLKSSNSKTGLKKPEEGHLNQDLEPNYIIPESLDLQNQKAVHKPNKHSFYESQHLDLKRAQE